MPYFLVIKFLHPPVILVAMSSTIKSYFERKKRDISDKSNNEDKREKARQSSLDLSLSKEPSSWEKSANPLSS